MQARWNCDLPPGTISCVLCRGIVTYVRDSNREDFFSHLKNEHRIHINHNLVLAVNLLSEPILEKIVNSLGAEDCKNELVLWDDGLEKELDKEYTEDFLTEYAKGGEISDEGTMEIKKRKLNSTPKTTR